MFPRASLSRQRIQPSKVGVERMRVSRAVDTDVLLADRYAPTVHRSFLL